MWCCDLCFSTQKGVWIQLDPGLGCLERLLKLCAVLLASKGKGSGLVARVDSRVNGNTRRGRSAAGERASHGAKLVDQYRLGPIVPLYLDLSMLNRQRADAILGAAQHGAFGFELHVIKDKAFSVPTVRVVWLAIFRRRCSCRRTGSRCPCILGFR